VSPDGTTTQKSGIAAPRPRRLGVGLVVWALLLLALGARIGYIIATPDYQIAHDARDYDRHARSIATGEGYAKIGAGPDGLTAFRPPAYPYFLAGTYAIAGVARADTAERIRAGRIANAIVGMAIVVLIGLLAAQLFDRRIALAAMALAAVYVPLVLVGGALMSEPLFAALMLAALVAAIRHRRSAYPFRWAVIAGLLAGLMILARANALVLLAPLALAVWTGRPWRARRSMAAPALLVAVALATVAPWTIRNAVVLHSFVPVSTQFGSALAGTYNDEARADRENRASWRSPRHIDQYQYLVRHPRWRQVPEPQLDTELRAAAMRYAADHPAYVAKVAYWDTLRMLDLAGLNWSRHTAATISVAPDWADAGVVCFWVIALLAVAGAFSRRRGRLPLYVAAFPLLVYLSVVFMVFETPRYRTGIDPFILLLAAVALVGAWDAVSRARRGGDRRTRPVHPPRTPVAPCAGGGRHPGA
jgi:MYXO-CTERM domain-containing protein